MSALRLAALSTHLSKRFDRSLLRLYATEARRQDHVSIPSESITASWSFKLDFGDNDKESKVSVTSVINELIKEWLGPRKKKGRERFSWFVRTKSTGREVDADGFLYKPGERLSIPGYLIRGVLYDLSSLSLGGGSVDRLVERGLISKELLPPAPDVEPETLGLGDLLMDQAGGSRLGSTSRLREGREEGGKVLSQSNPLNVQKEAIAALEVQSIAKGGTGDTERTSLRRRETEDELLGQLEDRTFSAAQASTLLEGGATFEGKATETKVLDMAAALDAIKGAAQPGNSPGSADTDFGVKAGKSFGSRPGNLAEPQRSETVDGASKAEAEPAGGGTWLTAALNETSREEQKSVAAAKREVELDKTIRNKYEGKLKDIREKAAARKREGRAVGPGAFDISRATKVGWKGGAIAVPGGGGRTKWRVLPGAGELLKHLKERGLKQGLFVSASDPDKDETLQQLLDFNFSPLEEVATADEASGTRVSAETFRRVCDQWGLPPKQVLVVTGPGPTGRALLDAVASSGCYLCQMTPYGVAPVEPPPTSPPASMTSAAASGRAVSAEDGKGSDGLSLFKQWLGIDDKNSGAREEGSRGKPKPHFRVEDVPGLKAVVEDLNGISYRRSTMMRGLGSGRERAAASADTEKVFT